MLAARLGLVLLLSSATAASSTEMLMKVKTAEVTDRRVEVGPGGSKVSVFLAHHHFEIPFGDDEERRPFAPLHDDALHRAELDRPDGRCQLLDLFVGEDAEDRNRAKESDDGAGGRRSKARGSRRQIRGAGIAIAPLQLHESFLSPLHHRLEEADRFRNAFASGVVHQALVPGPFGHFVH